MPDRRTQSYAAVPREVHDDIAEQVRTGVFARVARHRRFAVERVVLDSGAVANFARLVDFIDPDPEDGEPELPPSPTFWPRDEKEPPP